MKRNHNPKRIFIALPIEQPLIEQIQSWQKTYQAMTVRWLVGKNLHITLVPPWKEEYPENLIDKIRDTIPKTIGPIPLQFDQTSFGPDPRKPRLIWATGKAPQELLLLKKTLELITGHADNRSHFLLHLTIARFQPNEFKAIEQIGLNKHISWETTASSVVVMESKLLPSGADYTVLGEIKL